MTRSISIETTKSPSWLNYSETVLVVKINDKAKIHLSKMAWQDMALTFGPVDGEKELLKMMEVEGLTSLEAVEVLAIAKSEFNI